jgi:hypothetical protein
MFIKNHNWVYKKPNTFDLVKLFFFFKILGHLYGVSEPSPFTKSHKINLWWRTWMLSNWILYVVIEVITTLKWNFIYVYNYANKNYSNIEEYVKYVLKIFVHIICNYQDITFISYWKNWLRLKDILCSNLQIFLIATQSLCKCKINMFLIHKR